ncbi:MAG: hypothetical protein JO290_03340 [Sphingomonadaceae bacterium]|nr:hypothetical protein [Sphingomonadaceae bacterium]
MAEQQRPIPQIIAIPWYRRADYPSVLAVMVDAERLPPTFDRWQKRAQSIEAERQASGLTTFRAYLDPQQFVAWCAATNRNVDAQARIDWANAAAFEHWRDQNR